LIDDAEVKAIGSILFLKNGLKKIAEKKYKNQFRSNDFEVCTATCITCCFANILNVMALENVKLSSDKIGRPP
jgi:hypothetical protein